VIGVTTLAVNWGFASAQRKSDALLDDRATEPVPEAHKHQGAVLASGDARLSTLISPNLLAEMANSAHQCRNVHGAFAINGPLPDGIRLILRREFESHALFQQVSRPVPACCSEDLEGLVIPWVG